MPPTFYTSYDPGAGFGAATGPYGPRGRRNPLLPEDVYSYLDALPYTPNPYQAGALRGGTANPYPTSPYVTGALRATTRPEQAFAYGEPTPPPPPPAPAFPFASELDRSLYGGQNLAPPSNNPLVPTAQSGQVPAPALDPATAALQQLINWQVIQQANLEEQRRIQQQQFEENRADAQRAAIINAFGSYGASGTPMPIEGGGWAQEQQAAREAIRQQTLQAQALRNQNYAASLLNQQADEEFYRQNQGITALRNPDINPPPVMSASGPVGGGPGTLVRPVTPMAQGRIPGGWSGETTRAPARPQPLPVQPVPITVDTSPGQSQSTMLANKANGIRLQREGVRPDRAQPGGEFDRLQRMAGDTSPEGQANWDTFEQWVLQNSPRASMLARGEDAGNMTPAERAYYMGLRRRGRAR